MYICMYRSNTFVCTMYDICITLGVMKIPKTFRLSEDAVNVLNEQENATEFLELLILRKQTYSRAEVEMIDLLNEIKESVGTPGAFISENKTSAAELKKPENNLVGSATPNIEQLKSITGMQTASELEYGDYDGF